MTVSGLPGTKGRRRLYLMRHGHVDYFSAPRRIGGADVVPLTHRGREEATAAGLALSHVPFDRAVCSGLPRARETAEIVLSQQAGPVPDLLNDERIRELRGGGARLRAQIFNLAELSRQIYQAFAEADRPGAAMGEGGEPFVDAYARVCDWAEHFLIEPDWATALVVAHEGVNRLLLGWATGAGLAAVGPFEQDTGCLNVIDVDVAVPVDGDPPAITRRIIKAVNLTPYNYVKHGMNQTSLEAIFSR
ncbi:MAG: histidine phosphatase family protein [Alphaproteobacteria bacterium]